MGGFLSHLPDSEYAAEEDGQWFSNPPGRIDVQDNGTGERHLMDASS
jgi:hypothetical protein